MKAGLWEVHLSHSDGGGVVHSGLTQQCMDAATLAPGRKTGADFLKANCSKNETRGGGGRWVSDTSCTTGGSTMTIHSVMTMASDNAYHTDLTTTYDPPTAGRTPRPPWRASGSAHVRRHRPGIVITASSGGPGAQSRWCRLPTHILPLGTEKRRRSDPAGAPDRLSRRGSGSRRRAR